MMARSIGIVDVVVLFVICGLLACLATGCGAEYWTGRIEPVTVFKYNPWTGAIELRDTKENTIELMNLTAGTNGDKSISIESLRILNHSAPVIAADAARMEAVEKIMQIQVDYQRQIGMNAAMIIAAGGDAVSKNVSTFLGTLPKIDLGIDTPWGSGTGVLTPTTRPGEGPGVIP